MSVQGHSRRMESAEKERAGWFCPDGRVLTRSVQGILPGWESAEKERAGWFCPDGRVLLRSEQDNSDWMGECQ
ncbi:hypothetical protein [Paenibacillus dendritiformis]|uniref:hypothetical protein n=1 Tax=Paenibacillus dendritiformis TaxID=130049 RepID=UPI00387E1501